MNNTKENLITKWLILLSGKIKINFAILAAAYLFLILYDVIFLKNNIFENYLEYIKTIIISVLVWWGIKFVFWFQIKNPYYNEVFFNVASVFTIVITLIISIVNILSFILYGFNSVAFVFPLIPISVINVQKYRKENISK